MRVNLLRKKKKETQANWLKLLLIILMAIICLQGYYWYRAKIQIGRINAENHQLNSQIEMYQAEEQEYKELHQEIRGLLRMEKVKPIFWPEIIEELADTMPRSVLIDRLTIEDEQITITGKAAHNSDLLLLVSELKKSRFYREIKLQQLERQENLSFQIKGIIAEDRVLSEMR